ncbi:MFS transporter [Actinoplanes sp. NPDC051346]|uniref:MFS transporter n=1 Tax=Actinoplanes sp. NPDC051346 TaxID=3155048 RepID=UPI003420B6FA
MTHTVPRTDRGRWLALGALCAGQLMIVVDQTIVNVALPTIQRGLGLTPAGLAWVVNVYLIAFGGLLLLAGRLGDLLGRRRVFVAGLGVFTVASLLCGLAGSGEALVAARFLQGAGGAMAASVALGMIVSLFPEPAELARAMGFFGFVAAAGAALGQAAGGYLTSAWGWSWIFYVNVPVGVLTALVAWWTLGADAAAGRVKGADAAGAALVTAGLMLGVYTIVGVAEYGWLSGHTLGFGAAAAVLLVGFAARELTAANPLLPPRLLRNRRLLGANAVQFLLVAAMFSFLFLATLYAQGVLGYSPSRTGLAFLPVALVIGVVSLALSAPLISRLGGLRVLVGGLLLIAAGLALLARAPIDGVYQVDLLPAFLLLAIGFGAAMPALMGLAVSALPPAESGLASGVFNTTQQVGGALGLAVLATVAGGHTSRLAERGAAPAEALTGGYHVAFALAAALVIAGAALALATLGGGRARAPEPSFAEAAAG